MFGVELAIVITAICLSAWFGEWLEGKIREWLEREGR